MRFAEVWSGIELPGGFPDWKECTHLASRADTWEMIATKALARMVSRRIVVAGAEL